MCLDAASEMASVREAHVQKMEELAAELQNVKEQCEVLQSQMDVRTIGVGKDEAKEEQLSEGE